MQNLGCRYSTPKFYSVSATYILEPLQSCGISLFDLFFFISHVIRYNWSYYLIINCGLFSLMHIWMSNVSGI